MTKEQIKATKEYIELLEDSILRADRWSWIWMSLMWVFLMLWAFEIH